MDDTDSYLIKCTLESIEAGVAPEDIQAICECQMGFKICGPDIQQKSTNGEK